MKSSHSLQYRDGHEVFSEVTGGRTRPRALERQIRPHDHHRSFLVIYNANNKMLCLVSVYSNTPFHELNSSARYDNSITAIFTK